MSYPSGRVQLSDALMWFGVEPGSSYPRMVSAKGVHPRRGKILFSYEAGIEEESKQQQQGISHETRAQKSVSLHFFLKKPH